MNPYCYIPRPVILFKVFQKNIEQEELARNVQVSRFMSSRFANSSVLRSAGAPADAGAGRGRLQEEVAVLFDRFRDPLLRYLCSFRLTVPDGEEILQDVFLALFRHLDRGKSVENVRGWLFRVAHNLALRRRYRTRRDFETLAETGIEDRAADPALNPEDRLSHTQAQQRLQAVVVALPEQDRRCLSLRAEGLRYREIGGVLDMSLGAVSITLARSLARIARSSER
jgi:RNA polymerase sigma-70 factor, ECF subfamily